MTVYKGVPGGSSPAGSGSGDSAAASQQSCDSYLNRVGNEICQNNSAGAMKICNSFGFNCQQPVLGFASNGWWLDFKNSDSYLFGNSEFCTFEQYSQAKAVCAQNNAGSVRTCKIYGFNCEKAVASFESNGWWSPF